MVKHSSDDVLKKSDSSARQKLNQIENLNYLYKNVLKMQL